MSELFRKEEDQLPQDDISNLDWLEGRSWADLTDYEKKLIIESQSEENLTGYEELYIPVRAVSSLIGLMLESGVIDAGRVDVDFIKHELGPEHAFRPYKIEAALERLTKQRIQEAEEDNLEQSRPIVVEDVINELAAMIREEEYEINLDLDINFLKKVGIDPRQLEEMRALGREKQDEIHSLACDLRTPLAADIAQYYIEKNRGRRPVMLSFQDMFLSVVARKLREARRGSDLLAGDEDALRQAVRMMDEMKQSKEGLIRLLEIQTRLDNTPDGRELLTAIWEMELIIKEERRRAKEERLRAERRLFTKQEFRWN